jgi:hypothetical protein
LLEESLDSEMEAVFSLSMVFLVMVDMFEYATCGWKVKC